MGVVVVLESPGDFAESEHSGQVKAFHLVHDVRVVEVHIAETHKAIGMCLDEFACLGQSFGRDQQYRKAIGLVEFFE